ncbi:MAG: hypothetical protein LBV44_00560 [Methylobacillus sp.]|jgi:hypothetical protein|nr:hypothetical protein [Methylobacillus sp.]
MSFFKKLFGKKDDASAPPPSAEPADSTPADIAPELAPALQALENEEYEKVVVLALPHVADSADASRLCALACSRLGRWPEAFGHWLHLFELEPGAHNALQLASASVMCNEIERGKAWLQKYQELNEQKHELSGVSAFISFTSALSQIGHPEEGLPYIAWIRDLYAALHITDDTFLYMRGVPFFSAFLENSLPFVKASMNLESGIRWYRELEGKLDEPGEARLQEWIAQLPEM